MLARLRALDVHRRLSYENFELRPHEIGLRHQTSRIFAVPNLML